jgi:cell division protease FtsH
VVNEAALLSVRQGQELIDPPTLEEAIDRVVAGPAKKTHVMSVRERQVIAIHEAAHAVVARAVGQSTGAGVQKLSIVARGRTLGTAASQLVDKDVTVLQEHDLQRQLCAILAGAAGEKVQFGVVSTAVNDDLHAATNLARSMVTSFGMSAELGMVTIGEQGGEVFLGASLQELGSVGPATLELIDREIERLVAEAVERASALLRANWDAVREIAQVLLDLETVSGVALEALLTPVAPIEVDEIRVNGRRPVE